jgi:hypothetical protein
MKTVHYGFTTSNANHFDLETSDIKNGFYLGKLEAGKWAKTIRIAVMH